MTIRHMRIFLEVVRCNSMSAAAKQLYISQPTVSQAVAEIEELYGIKLFERLSKKLYITQAGEQLHDYASRITSLYNEMESMLRSGQAKQLRLGATLTVGTCIFSELIAAYRAVQPDIETRVVVENTKEIEGHLLAGDLDIGLVEGRITHPDIVYEPVISDTMVLVSSPVRLLGSGGMVSMKELHGEPFIMREKGSGTREFFERSMREKGYALNCLWVCHNTDAIKNAVMAGHGLTVISRRLVQRELERGLMRAYQIEGYSDQRTFALTYHKDKFLFPYHHDFFRLCREFERPKDGEPG